MVKMGLLGTGSVKITMEQVSYIPRNSRALRIALNGLEIKKILLVLRLFVARLRRNASLNRGMREGLITSSL